MDKQELQNQIIALQQQIEELRQAFYKGNFSSQQDFSKYCNFTNRLKVPHYDTAPATAEVGEIIEVGGKLYICNTANNFVLVGGQS